MSLGIFSFDLAAIINSLSNFVDTISEQEVSPTENPSSLERTEEVLQNVAVPDSIISDVLMETALKNTVTSVIAMPEAPKKEATDEKTVVSPPIIRVPSQTLDEETRKEIERLIKSLQTSVIHNYQSTDIIDETVALNNVQNFPRRKPPQDSEERKDSIELQKKSEEHKREMLREELKRAILRNNNEV